MLSYSPYDNVKAQAYPTMLVTTGLHDSQVQYFEPAKWVARLRASTTGKNPILFAINMEAGHGGQIWSFRKTPRDRSRLRVSCSYRRDQGHAHAVESLTASEPRSKRLPKG